MSKLIEDYALLGDGETVALLAKDGSIHWLCWPRFDDDACSAALLGTDDHGHWSLAPVSAVTACGRRYQGDTLVMETDFVTNEGQVRIIDFHAAARQHLSSAARIVVGMRGTEQMRSTLRLRFDYGALPPWSATDGNDMVASFAANLVVLRAPVQPRQYVIKQSTRESDVSAGERLAFVMSYGCSHEGSPTPIDAESGARFNAKVLARLDWPVPQCQNAVARSGHACRSHSRR